MIPFLVGLSLMFIALLSFCIWNAHKSGKLAKELELEKQANEMQEERDEIAKKPSLSPTRLIEWMRSPHSRF